MENELYTGTSAPPPKKDKGLLRELILFSAIALAIVLPVRMFIAQPFIVSGASMEPTFDNGQYLIVDQVSYRLNNPERGDVIIFRYPKEPSKFFIKRIIGLPGERVTIEGNTVRIFNNEHPNGTILNEPYVAHMNADTTLEEVLAPDEYFVMGDNRDASSDSRMWGDLPKDMIIGRALLRLSILPAPNVDLLPGKFSSEEITN